MASAGGSAASQGGLKHVELPPSLTVSTFTAARTKEIQAMKKVISQSSGTKMAFQKLPKHMRRRAMSHTVKRLPRRLRQIHLNQMTKSGLAPKQKRPTRKFRRRPTNLLQDYIRRRKRVKWLYTHIWHAKRFHMVEKWGYKIPDRPCDKAFRSCYRATSKHCLIQDISYYQCIEISGKYDIVVEGLKKITLPNLGLSIGAKCFQNGRRSGNITIFETENKNLHFKKAIGEVKFLWNTKNDTLWMFVHPAYYQQVFETIANIFKAKSDDMETDAILDDKENKLVKKDSKETLKKENIMYSNENNVKIRELHQEISTFRLTGPLSNAVLQNAFKLPNFDTECPKLLAEWLNNSDLTQFSEEKTYWESLKTLSSTTQLPPNMVLGLVVRDPRYNFPQKRTKSWPQNDDFDTSQNLGVLPENLGVSPLWNDSVREFVEKNKVSNAKISEVRSQILVPGTVLENTGLLIPIILVQRPGVQEAENLGYSSGWDILLPSSYAQSFWLSLIMWGARAGGLRETNSIRLESSKSDILPPDTFAGKIEDKFISKQHKEKYFRLPPNKRTNFTKFGIVSPFDCQWTMLVNDWRLENEHFEEIFALRDRKILREIQEFLNTKKQKKSNILPALPSNCLIPVKLKLSQKGKCKKYSVICLPKQSDYKNEPLELVYKDKYRKLRIKTRQEHRNLLQRLSRRRKRARNKGKPIKPTDTEELKKYQEKMRSLWLPPAENIRLSCSREILGFVQNGDYSFNIGTSKATGYIVARSLEHLTTLPFRNKVLVRNTNSRQYRLAKLDVIL